MYALLKYACTCTFIVLYEVKMACLLQILGEIMHMQVILIGMTFTVYYVNL